MQLTISVLDITIILIAHRLDTVKKCNIIYKLDKGEIVGQGSFDELIFPNLLDFLIPSIICIVW
jgi:ABC-type multidrug transport system fused ATPase/permease subunit